MKRGEITEGMWVVPVNGNKDFNGMWPEKLLHKPVQCHNVVEGVAWFRSPHWPTPFATPPEGFDPFFPESTLMRLIYDI